MLSTSSGHGESMTSKFDRKDIRVLRVSCEHSLEGDFRVHLTEKDWSSLCEAFDSVQRDNVDLSQEKVDA